MEVPVLVLAVHIPVDTRHGVTGMKMTHFNPFAAAKKMFEFFREISYSGSYKQKNESY